MARQITKHDAVQRLTQAQFKALVKYKGWSMAAIADRWGITVGWLRDTVRDPTRPLRFDDALNGLPNLNRLRQEVARREKRLNAAMGLLPPPKPVKESHLLFGHRYRPYLTVGAIVGVTKDVGSIAEESSRGIVFDVTEGPVSDRYGVVFESGMWDWFDPDSVDEYLAASGLVCKELVGYKYVDEQELENSFARGQFSFYPVT